MLCVQDYSRDPMEGDMPVIVGEYAEKVGQITALDEQFNPLEIRRSDTDAEYVREVSATAAAETRSNMGFEVKVTGGYARRFQNRRNSFKHLQDFQKRLQERKKRMDRGEPVHDLLPQDRSLLHRLSMLGGVSTGE
jgi:hypothetical protein